MKNKILKLVLNKQKSNSSKILNKKDGNITSLISGLMFLMIILILLLFNFRVSMISEVLYNIDDVLTLSALGTATPNSDAFVSNNTYYEQGQLVMQDADKTDMNNNSDNGEVLVDYKQSTNSEKKYIDSSKEYNEQKVVISELNSNLINNGRYDSARVNNVDNIHLDCNGLKRLGYTASYNINGDEATSYRLSKIDNRSLKYNNQYMLTTLNRMISLTYDNIVQRSVSSPKLTSIFNTSKGVTDEITKAFTISKNDIVNKAFLGSYISSNIYVTRAEIYNLYRYTLAKRHVYASPYIAYKVNGVSGYTWDGYNKDGTVSNKPKIQLSNGISSNAVKNLINSTQYNSGSLITSPIKIEIDDNAWIGPTIEDDGTAGNNNDFKDLMQELYPAMIIPGREPSWLGTPPESDYAMYNLMRALWKLDLEAYNNRNTRPLIFWEDTGISCQTDWWSNENTLKYNYGYLWDNNSLHTIPITDTMLITDKANRKLLPLEGYSSYIYVKGNTSILSQYNNFSNGNGTLNTGMSLSTITLGDYNYGVTVSGSTTASTTESNKSVDDVAYSAQSYKNRKTNSELYHSSIYLETAYNVATFPSNGNFLYIGDFANKTVVSSKLVSITKKTAVDSSLLPHVHNYVEVARVRPTCTHDGSVAYGCIADEGTGCDNPQYTSPTAKIDHIYVDGKCTMCGKIEQIDINEVEIEEIQPCKLVNGKATPDIVVKYNGNTLVKDTDYTIAYSNNTSIGQATVTITGKGTYKGSKSATFTVIN